MWPTGIHPRSAQHPTRTQKGIKRMQPDTNLLHHHHRYHKSKLKRLVPHCINATRCSASDRPPDQQALLPPLRGARNLLSKCLSWTETPPFPPLHKTTLKEPRVTKAILATTTTSWQRWYLSEEPGGQGKDGSVWIEHPREWL